MTNLINLISERKFTQADEEIASMIPLIMEKKIHEMKKAVAAKMCEQMGKTASEKVRLGIMEDEIEEEITSNLKDADNLQTKNMQKVFDKPGAIKRIMSPVAKDPKFTKDQNKNPQGSFGVSSEKQDRGLPPSSDSLIDKSKEYLRRSTPSKNLKEEELDESDLPITKKKEKIWIHTHKTSGKEKHMNTPKPASNEWEVKELKEESLDEARVNIIKARIRGGKIQRRKKVSNVPGMTLRGGTLKRMSAAERRRRKMGARKAKVKRRAKMTRTLMKRKRSLQKRKSLGL